MLRRGLLPQREIERRMLVSLPVQLTCTLLGLVECPSGEYPVPVVAVVFLHIEIHRAVADVCVAGVQNLLHQLYLLYYVPGSPRLDGRRGHVQQPHRLVVAQRVCLHHLHRLELLQPGLLGYLVLSLIRIVLQVSYISYVPDIAYFIAQVPEQSDEYVVCDSRPGMPQMRIPVDCRAAHVKPHMALLQRDEKLLFP